MNPPVVRRRVGFVGLIVAVVLVGWSLYAWTALRPEEIASDWHGWRQTDTQTIALNFTKPGASILWPQISWGGDGPGYVETEFQLYPRIVSLLMGSFGKGPWVGQLVSLLAIAAAAGVVFVHLSRRFHVAAVLGFGTFLAARLSPHLATAIMPDALALLAYVVAWTYFWQYAKDGRTRHLVVYGIVGTIAMLTKPTTAHLGISSFLLLVLMDRSRLRDYRVWIAWGAMVAVFAVYLAHAHQLYAEYGNTFGLLAGEDSKAPHLKHLLMPQPYVRAARFGLIWGLGAVAALALIVQALRRRLDPEHLALAAGNIVLVFIALRYMSDGAGIHYFAPVALLAASLVASLAHDASGTRLRYPALAIVGLLVLLEGYRNITVREFNTHVYRDDSVVASVVATGQEIDRLTEPGDLIVVRSPNRAYDTFWEQAANYHDPRIFYLSETRGWTLGREQDDPALAADAANRGARFLADPLTEPSPVLEAWLVKNADLVWSRAAGGRIWKLHAPVVGGTASAGVPRTRLAMLARRGSIDAPDQVFLKLSYATIPLFWPIWIVTGVAAAYLSVRTSATWRSAQPFKALDSSSLLIGALLIPYLAVLLWGIDFAYHDDEVFIDFTASGQPWPVAIWPYVGRYFPLHSQEFNVLALIGPTPIVYYSFVAVQLIAFCWLVAAALSDLPIGWRVAAVAVLLMSNSIAIVFAEAVYPERNIVFSLAALIVLLQRADYRLSRLNMLAALLAVQVALYLKEPVFLLITTVVLTRLTIAWREARPVAWSWLRTRPLDVGLLVLCAVFAVQFAVSLLAFAGSRYLTQASVGSWNAAMYYLRNDPLLWVFVAGIVLRVPTVRRRGLDPIWDSLALGALVYLVMLVLLGLAADRYMPPVDMVGLLFAVRQAADWWHREPSGRWLIGTAAAGLAAATALFGAFRLLEHKSVVRGTVELAEFVRDYTAGHSGEIRLYFPGAEGWRVMNFAAHLRYRDREVFERVRFLGPHEFPDGQCVSYRPYRCERALAPAPDDIVVHLPDDAKRVAFPQARPLFEYQFLPGALPVAIGRFLYPSTQLGAGGEMPVGWLTATALSVPSPAKVPSS